MNEKFFALPKQKQNAIINAGYRVFSQNSYRKSPMSEIAGEAGISKSLLFHYFHNKKELYLFLWDNCAKLTIKYLTEYKCYEQTDLFEMMYRGMRVKIRIMNQYPNMGSFVIKAFYERDPDISSAIHSSFKSYKAFKAEKTLENIDTTQFAEGIAVMMYFLNIIANLTESAEFLKYITPFGYADGAEIVRNVSLDMNMIAIGLLFAVVGILAGFIKYCRKDIS